MEMELKTSWDDLMAQYAELTAQETALEKKKLELQREIDVVYSAKLKVVRKLDDSPQEWTLWWANNKDYKEVPLGTYFSQSIDDALAEAARRGAIAAPKGERLSIGAKNPRGRSVSSAIFYVG